MSANSARGNPSPTCTGWFPVARLEELVPRHVMQAELQGQELALWRDDAGGVNAWENRCPHRGVRLSIGLNTGSELRCQYHGWRYGSGGGRCTFIPAHPQHAPPRVVRALPYATRAHLGFLWVNLGAEWPGACDDWESGPVTTFRSVHVHAPLPRVSSYLEAGAGLALPLPEAPEGGAAVTLLLQPMNPEETMIHGYAGRRWGPVERLRCLLAHDARLTVLRDAIEAEKQHLAEAVR